MGVNFLGILKFLSRAHLPTRFVFCLFFFCFSWGFMGISCRTGSLGSLNRLELQWCRCLSLLTKDFASYLFRSFCSFGSPTTKHLLSLFLWEREREYVRMYTPQVLCVGIWFWLITPSCWFRSLETKNCNIIFFKKKISKRNKNP